MRLCYAINKKSKEVRKIRKRKKEVRNGAIQVDVQGTDYDPEKN